MPHGPLAAWLARLEQRSPESRIKLGLERVKEVLERLSLNRLGCPVITVAGTNGKGSTVAFLESMALAAGLKPYAYSSPHLINFSERIRVGGMPADEELIVAALEQVESARQNTDISYFEHVTLAGLVVADAAIVDLMILEVGLGGRLDAVNIIDPDVAIMTSIGLDHADWLGRTRRAIGREKAGIARAGRPLVVGERHLPPGFLTDLEQTGADLYLAGQRFRWRRLRKGFSLGINGARYRLPAPGMAGAWQLANGACAVTAVKLLADRLAIDQEAIAMGLVQACVPGRLQRFGHAPVVIADVAHNGPAARALASELASLPGRCFAVFSLLEGKDLAAIARALDGHVNHWLVAPLAGARGQGSEVMAAGLRHIPVTGTVEALKSVSQALETALNRAEACDHVIVFGSFRTVAEAWPSLVKR